MQSWRARTEGRAALGNTARPPAHEPRRAARPSPSRRAGLRYLGGASALTLTLAVVAPPAAGAASSKAFCAAVRTFNSTRPSTKTDSSAALRRLAHASPTEVKNALEGIVRALDSGDPAAVLGQASTIPTAQPTALTLAGTAVANTANLTCHIAINFQSAVPTGISKRTVDPRVWARTVCTSLGAWGQSLRASGSNLVTQSNGLTTLDAVRTALSEFLGASITMTRQLVTDLGGAGIPKVPEGASFALMVHDGLTQAQQTFTNARPAAQALPENPQAFQARAQALVQEVDHAGRQVEALIRNAELRVKAPALSKAFAFEAACTGIA